MTNEQLGIMIEGYKKRLTMLVDSLKTELEAHNKLLKLTGDGVVRLGREEELWDIEHDKLEYFRNLAFSVTPNKKAPEGCEYRQTGEFLVLEDLRNFLSSLTDDVNRLGGR